MCGFKIKAAVEEWNKNKNYVMAKAGARISFGDFVSFRLKAFAKDKNETALCVVEDCVNE